jgi:hypothetical protein
VAASTIRFDLLAIQEAEGLARARYFLYFVIAVSAIAPILTTIAAILEGVDSPMRVPIFSDLLRNYPVITIGASAVFLGMIGLVTRYRVFARFLSPPIVALAVGPQGIILRNSRGAERAVSWEADDLRLELDAYSPALALPNAEGYHWGRVLFVSGYRGGWCQVDDAALAAILESAAAAGVTITRLRRKTLEGPAERLSFRQTRG